MSPRMGASKQRARAKAWALLFAIFPLGRTRSEDSADRIGRKSPTNVLRQESEGEVTQGDAVSTVVTESTLSLSLRTAFF
jgi:hypothetical protein